MTSTAQQHNADRIDSALYLNDLVSLPIIITDFDIQGVESKKSDDSSPAQTPSSESNTTAGDASVQKWATGFNDFADEVWKSMTAAMRSKLRDAAVEVLKRTDDTKFGARGELWGEWDDDARLLD